jgi:hypothetical protein
MSTYATFYLSRAQKFEVKTSTDQDRDEVKVEIKTGFDNITIGVSKDQANELKGALEKEMGGGKQEAEPDRDVPF